MKKMIRVSLAALAVALAAQTGVAQTTVTPINEYYCWCACPGGGAVHLVDNNPNCKICSQAAQYCPSAS
ncbi:MAG TPA: hypothetical protein VHN15_09305 [Thermoanaerobaculia bacterium]|nr:hypothetical protein [Thermoanaerobaculia bacterium]